MAFPLGAPLPEPGSTATIDRLVAELQDEAVRVQWPADQPEVRQSWADALARDPYLLRTQASEFQETVYTFFMCLEGIGNNMTRFRPEERDSACRSFDAHTKEYGRAKKAVRGSFATVLGVIDLSERPYQGDLRRVAFANLMYLAGNHDFSGDIATDLDVMHGDTDSSTRYIRGRGVHLMQLGLGVMNMLEHGSVRPEPLKYHLGDWFGRCYSSLHPDGPSIDSKGLANVTANADQFNIYRCVFNLVRNAHKRGGATQVRMSATQDDTHTHISIEDNGCGLPNTDAIFDCGTTFANGQGLGLFLVKYVTEAHGGTVTAVAHNDDPVFNGAKFTMSLPKENADGYVHYPTEF